MNHKNCYHKVIEIIKADLNARDRIGELNTLNIPVMTYSFNIIDWSITEICKVAREIVNCIQNRECTTTQKADNCC